MTHFAFVVDLPDLYVEKVVPFRVRLQCDELPDDVHEVVREGCVTLHRVNPVREPAVAVP